MPKLNNINNASDFFPGIYIRCPLCGMLKATEQSMEFHLTSSHNTHPKYHFLMALLPGTLQSILQPVLWDIPWTPAEELING